MEELERITEESEVEYYPLDPRTITKGRVFLPEEIADLTGHRVESPKFWSATLRLKKWMLNARHAMGKPVLMKGERGGLRVLMDNEGSAYKSHRYEGCVRGAMREHRQLGWVDRTNLTAEEQTDHDRRIFLQSKQIQGLITTREELNLETYQRKAPRLLKDSPKPPEESK